MKEKKYIAVGKHTVIKKSTWCPETKKWVTEKEWVERYPEDKDPSEGHFDGKYIPKDVMGDPRWEQDND
tara:strand:+ start:508 stop:714 length:207 start_codon:yes stop_codon:yes gene_type:complete